MRTTSGPEWRKSCLPTLKTPTSLASSATRRSASAKVSTSRATISRWRMLSGRGGRKGQRFGGLAELRVGRGEGHDQRAVGCERRRPDDARVVVVLLDRGGDRAGDADAVAAHLDRPLCAPRVEEGGTHRLAVFRAEQED